ncbi:MAG: histidinol-phosphate transaminase [Bacteroidales bacterium]|nr:histidinol-phosphate transaminase [Bacteroidales bacterium]
MNLEKYIRQNILALAPYSCARDEFKGNARVFVDANENPFQNGYNRYPDPLQWALKEKIAKIKGVRPTQIMLGNGSDEPIDLVYRIFTEPQKDNAVAIAPSYGMYGVCADINNVEYKKVVLDEGFKLNADKVLAAVDANTHVIWLCSPNNPSGNLLNRAEIEKILNKFEGIVVIDEAYADFSSEESWLNSLDKYKNLIVLQTFSKAWGLAGVRCGMAFASEEIISYFNKVKYPYNINLLTQEFVFKKLDEIAEKEKQVKIILEQRARLAEALLKKSKVKKVYPSDANFLLVEVDDANAMYKELADKEIVTRNRTSVTLCHNCLRITVGTPEENDILLSEIQ